MGRNGKYEGGSKVVPFRLPVRYLVEAKKGIEDYLKRFESNKAIVVDSDPVTDFWDGKVQVTNTEFIRLTPGEDPYLEKAKKMVKIEPELVIVKPKKNIGGGVIKFPCGCFVDGVLFRRFPGCKILNENHNEEYNKK